jgi:hypothetical protein
VIDRSYLGDGSNLASDINEEVGARRMKR